MTAAAGDAHDFCIYGARHRVTFPILDADGDPITATWTGMDSTRSIDQATAAACSLEAIQIAGTFGMGYLDLIATETTGKNVSVNVHLTNTGAKDTPLSIPIVRLPVLRSGTAQAGAGSTITLDSGASAKNGAYVGLYAQCTNNSPANVQGQTRKIISYVGSTRVATVEAPWGTNPSNATTFSLLLPPNSSVNVIAWNGAEVLDQNVDGLPRVDVTHWLGTAAATPTNPGVPEVDVTHNAGVSTAVTPFAVNTIQWAGSAVAPVTTAGVPEVDVTFWRGQAVPLTSQTGVPEVDVTFWNGSAAPANVPANVVQWGGSNLASVATPGVPDINVKNWNGSVVAAPTVAGVPEVDVTHVGGTVENIADATALATVHTNVISVLGFIDTEIAAILAAVDTEVAAIKAKTDLIPGTMDGKTFAEHILLQSSVLLGEGAGLGTAAAAYKALDDTALTRVAATVDPDGNRSAITYNTSSP